MIAETKKRPPKRVILVTGLSGAGRSTALKSLEDSGFEAIDNLPLTLLNSVVEGMTSDHPLAIGIDARTRHFTASALTSRIIALKKRLDLEVTLLFLVCSQSGLEKRFKETRRQHPLADGRPLSDGIKAEKRLLSPLRENSDLVLDTTNKSPGEFKQALFNQLGLSGQCLMTVEILSFSFRFGVPQEADMVFDARFLRNPYYDAQLRRSTGQDKAVQDYVKADDDFDSFSGSLTALVCPLLTRYEKEGKKHLTIAIGCTGGRHRSVTVAEWLYGELKNQWPRVINSHRDIHRDTERYHV